MTVRKLKTLDYTKLKHGDVAAVIIDLPIGQVYVTIGSQINTTCPGLHFEADVDVRPHFTPLQREVTLKATRQGLTLIQDEANPKPLKPDAITPEQRNFPDDLTGHRVVLNQKKFHGDLAKRTVLVTGGGGAKKNSLGSKIFYRDGDGTEDYVRIGDISHMAAPA